jgi:hypothetical protein
METLAIAAISFILTFPITIGKTKLNKKIGNAPKIT